MNYAPKMFYVIFSIRDKTFPFCPTWFFSTLTKIRYVTFLLFIFVFNTFCAETRKKRSICHDGPSRKQICKVDYVADVITLTIHSFLNNIV